MLTNLFKSYWKTLKNSPVSLQIFRMTYFVGLITVLSKLLFVVRDLLTAWTFGRSQFLEAFILAFLVPFAFTTALSSSLTITFLPRFIKLRENGEYNLANEIYANLLGILLSVSTVAMLFLVIAHDFYAPIMADSFGKISFGVMKNLFYITTPAALLHGVVHLWKEILNAKEKFVQSSAVSIITPLISIILLIVYQDTGVFVLAVGLLFGAILELILLGSFLRLRKFRLLPRINIFSFKLRISLKDWWKLFISTSLFNLMGLANSFMAARRAEVGGLAILNYGKKIVTLPIDISAITYSVVLIPYLSKMSANGQQLAIRKLLDRWMLLILVTTIPIVIVIIFSAEFIVSLLYERGAFGSADTKAVATVLIFYAFQLPFHVAFFVMLRILPIIEKNASALVFGVLGVGLTVLFNYIFIQYFGTSGIAIATSCVYFCLAVSLYAYVRRILVSKIEKQK